jgi:phenylacetate-CoA ligase
MLASVRCFLPAAREALSLEMEGRVISWSDQLSPLHCLAHRRFDRQQMVDFQQARLRRLVRHAYATVPYYRSLFDRHGIDPGDIRTVADLAALPLTTKNDLRHIPVEETLSRGLKPERLAIDRTSGTSGEPFTIRRTRLERRMTHLFWLRALHYLGLRPRDKRASLVYVSQARLAGRAVWNHALSALGLYRHLLIHCCQPLDRIARALADYGPDFLDSYSGVAAQLALAMTEQDRRRIHPRTVVVGAERLTDDMRRTVEAAFRVPVYIMYASHEFGLIAWQCKETGELHICDDSLIVEVLRDGRPAGDGEEGELVATNLHSFAMPFIRYRLGDLVTKGRQQCACGLPFSTIARIEGRMQDYLRLPGGRLMHATAMVVLLRENMPWSRRHQVVQTQEDAVVLRVVPAVQPTSEQVQQIGAAVAQMLGPPMRVSVELVPEIEPGPGGKFRGVHCLVGPPQWSASGRQ